MTALGFTGTEDEQVEETAAYSKVRQSSVVPNEVETENPVG